MKKFFQIALLMAVFMAAPQITGYAADNFSGHRRGLDSPVETIVEVTPDDGEDLAFKPRGIFVKDTGIVSLLDKDGNTTTFQAGEIATGIWHPMRPVRVLEATTATVLIGE